MILWARVLEARRQERLGKTWALASRPSAARHLSQVTLSLITRCSVGIDEFLVKHALPFSWQKLKPVQPIAIFLAPSSSQSHCALSLLACISYARWKLDDWSDLSGICTLDAWCFNYWASFDVSFADAAHRLAPSALIGRCTGFPRPICIDTNSSPQHAMHAVWISLDNTPHETSLVPETAYMNGCPSYE